MNPIESQEAESVNPVLLDQGDVIIEEIEPEMCSECEECRTTHVVLLDMRGNGYSHELLRGCAACCKDFAERLRESLPPRSAG